MILSRQLDRFATVLSQISRNIQHSKDFIEEWNRVIYFSKGSGDATFYEINEYNILIVFLLDVM